MQCRIRHQYIADILVRLDIKLLQLSVRNVYIAAVLVYKSVLEIPPENPEILHRGILPWLGICKLITLCTFVSLPRVACEVL